MEVLDYAIKKEKNRKSTAQIIKNKNFLELVGRNKQEEIQLTKSQLIDKVKEKMIQSLNELVREKSDDVRDIFKNVGELNLFISKV
jgi:glutamyl-tRNA reductase